MAEAKKEINIGICLLKIIMCFMVIVQHFFAILPKELNNLCKSACPIFMIISFLFVSKIFTERNFEKFKQRLVRLAIPFYLWSVIFSVIFYIANHLLNFNNDIKSDIIYQLLTGHGHGINAPLWYLFDTLLLTILFYLIFKVLSLQKAIIVLIVLFFTSIFLQYSGINYNTFGALIWGLKYPLGRLCEMIPYACIGFAFGYNKTLNNQNFSNSYIPQILILSVIILSVFIFFNGPINQFGYSGIYNVFLSSVFVLLFYNLKIQNELLKNIIVNISKYTLGIYCMHYCIGQFYKITMSTILNINLQNYIYQTILCIAIFITALLISAILYKIDDKYKIIRQMVS